MSSSDYGQDRGKPSAHASAMQFFFFGKATNIMAAS